VRIAGFWIPIDILPGVSSKTISLKDTERIRVAILPAPARPSQPPLAGFDPVKQLGGAHLTFGRTGGEQSLDSCTQGGANLVCQFKTAQTGFRPGDTFGILWVREVTPEGQEIGINFEGRGALQIVP
jgi:hypothetical protein